MSELSLTYVESTFCSEGGTPWRLELAPKTLLIGDNGTGKSAVLHAIEAALTQAVDDLNGKDRVRDPALLIELAAGSDTGGATARAVVGISNGDTAEWALARREDGSLPQRPDVSVPKCVDDNVLPMRIVTDVLGAERKVAEQALLRWAGSTLTEGDVLTKLPGIMHTRFKEIAAARIPAGTILEQLLGVQEYGKSCVQDTRNELLGAKRLVEGLSSRVGAQPTEAEIQQLQQDVADLQASIAAERARLAQPSAPPADAVQSAYAQLQQMWHAGAEASTALATAGEALSALRSAPPAAPREDALRRPERHRAALDLLTYAEQMQSPQCFACGLPGLQSAEHRGILREFHTAGSTRVPPEVVAWQQFSAQVQAAEAHFNRCQAVMTRATEDYQRAHAHYTRMSEAAPAPVLESQLDGSLADVERELSTLQHTLTQQIEARARWAQVDEARNQIVLMEEQLRKDMAFFGAVDDVIKRLSVQATRAFHARVQEYLPEGWTFEADATGTKRIRIGLKGADGQVRAATLSGGQRIAVHAALAMAVSIPNERAKSNKAGRKPGDPVLRVVTLPDRDVSDETRIALMRVWGTWPGQVILTATSKPKGRIPAGWAVVDVTSVFPPRATVSREIPQEEAEAPLPAAEDASASATAE